MSKKPKKSGKRNIKNAVVLPPELQLVFNQALANHKAGNLQEAANGYAQVIHHEGKHADAHHLLGLVFQAAGNLEQAREYIGLAIKLNPGVDGYHFNLGVIQQKSGFLGKAILSYRSAIQLNPKHNQALENLAVALQDDGQTKPALKAYEQALRVLPNSLISLKNLGTLYFRYGATTSALECFEAALTISPADPELVYKRSVSLLRLGRWRSGWLDYQSRHHPVRSFGLRYAEALDFKSKTILINREQGLGDEIMFSSCIPDLIAQGAKCILECDQRLVNLFERAFPKVEVVTTIDRVVKSSDCRLPIADLPRFFRNSDNSFPGSPYLFADEELRHVWRKRLKPLPSKLRIGFSWRGGSEERASDARNVTLGQWQKLIASVNADFINLQYKTSLEELGLLQGLGSNVIHFDELDAFSDIDGLAALMSELDLVISADNATVHLAGALGVETWVLLPEGPELRWTDGHSQSLWYSNVHLHRSSNLGWSAIFSQFINTLKDYCPQPRADFNDLTKTKSDLKMPVVQSESNPRLLLLNDTSDWYHWGCSCTSLALHQGFRERGFQVEGMPICRTANMLGLPDVDNFDSDAAFDEFRKQQAGIVSAMEQADLLVLNGEGSLHGVNSTSLGLLYLATIAKQRLGKPVHIINHSCYPPGAELPAVQQLYCSTYESMDTVAIREPRSLAVLNTLGIVAKGSFDCLPLFIEGVSNELESMSQLQNSCSRPVVIAGSVSWQQSLGEAYMAFIHRLLELGHQVEVLYGASAYLAPDDILFIRALQFKFGKRLVYRCARSELEWLNIINNASVLVSGRFHYSIAAAFLNTPFVVCESNSTKIAGLLEMLEMPEALAAYSDSLSERLMAMVTERKDEPSAFLLKEKVREALLVAARNNFSGL